MHPTTVNRISALLNTSATDAGVDLKLMLQRQGPIETLEVCIAALDRLEACGYEKISHRKALATTARAALKQLERGPQS